MHELAERAARWGIEWAYMDAEGRFQEANPDAVGQILASLGARSCQPDLGPAPAGTEHAYQGEDDRRRWLLAVQLYGVRSASNWGHGDFTDLAALVDLAADVGAAGIGLNPLHALFPDRAEQASPYAPNSRLFLNPLYIDVAAAPGFPGTAELGLSDELDRLRAAPLVDYVGVARAKMRALRAAYHRFRERADGHEDFAAFRRERGGSLERFAAFETLRQTFKSVWWDWPEAWRRPTEQGLAALRQSDAEELGFHEYVQWIADRQLRACQERARRRGCAIGLYIDLAVGVEPGGADAWADQDAFLNNLSVGAPPDALNTGGQDWGLTTFNPHCLAARNFEPFRELLAEAMRYAGAIRLDHILGLNRIYVIPRGRSARQGAYLRFPLDTMLNVVAEESQRYRCIVIGEDLGTVPEGFRQKLHDRGIWTYIVMMFEREWDGSFRGPERYPAHALATFATHDLATLAGWTSGHDLRVKRAIDVDPGETDEDRARALAAMRATLARYGEDGIMGVVRHLADAPTRLVAVSAEDVLSVQDQINVPGTIDQHPNWRWRLPVTIDEMRRDARLHRIAEAFRQAGRG